jgi:hypothetical protein
MPYIYLYAKSVDEVAMVKVVAVSKLTEGDRIYNDIKVGNKTIKANWGGLSKKDLELLKKSKRRVKIREGVAFTPVFAISFVFFFYLWFKGLRYSFW